MREFRIPGVDDEDTGRVNLVGTDAGPMGVTE